MSAPYLPTRGPWFYVNGEVCADAEGKVVIARRGENEPTAPLKTCIPAAQKDRNMRAIAELPVVLECLEHAAARTEVQAATLRAEAKIRHAEANIAHAEECERWAKTFRACIDRALGKGGKS